MCIFNEKVSIQEAKVADGVSALNSKEEELRFLRLERDELQRQVGLKQKDLPNRKNLNGELATLQVRRMINIKYFALLHSGAQNLLHATLDFIYPHVSIFFT